MIYRREIDGLRAIAVVSVLAYHAKVPGFTGGYLGVDVFFVISGFLICSILLAEIDREEFSLIAFYERRARRILPALVVVVTLTVPLAWYVLQPVKFIDFSESIIATVLFAANVYFWRTTSYFADDAENAPLLHTWSLAVEEQFYIVFPLVLYAIMRQRTLRPAHVLLLLALGSLILAEVGWRWKPEANFYLPTGRAWELLAGAVVAVGLSGRQPRRNPASDILAFSGLGLILYSIFVLDDTIPTPSLYTAVPVLGTALILHFAASDSPIARLLSLRPIVGVGLISYSLYLWHQPVLALGRASSAAAISGLQISSMLLVALFLAWLSWRFVERPFRRATRVSKRQVFWFSGLSSGALLLFTFAVIAFPDRVREVYIAALPADAVSRYLVIEEAAADSGPGAGADCVFWSAPDDVGLQDRSRRCATHGKGILILGDSHANDLFNALAVNDFAPFLMSLHQPGCQPHRRLNMRVLDPCDFDQLERTVVSLRDDIRMIIFTEAGGAFYGPGEGSFDPQRLYPELVDEMASFLERLHAASGLPILVLGVQPSPGFHPSRLNPRNPLEPQLAEALSDGTMTVAEEVDRELARRLAGTTIRFISKSELAEIDLPRDLLVDGKLTYRDGSHWNEHGEKVFGRRLRGEMMEVVGEIRTDGF